MNDYEIGMLWADTNNSSLDMVQLSIARKHLQVALWRYKKAREAVAQIKSPELQEQARKLLSGEEAP